MPSVQEFIDCGQLDEVFEALKADYSCDNKDTLQNSLVHAALAANRLDLAVQVGAYGIEEKLGLPLKERPDQLQRIIV